MQFKDRFQAGRLLAAKLTAYGGRNDVIVFALPRGGVEVGYEVATTLQAPLDVIVVRKVGLPDCPELGIGALASGGIESVSDQAVDYFRVSPEDLQNVIAQARKELHRQEELFRGNRPFPELRNKVALLVDDGLATGHTMEAAIAAVRGHAPGEIVVAVPVGAADTCRRLTMDVNRLVCLSTPIDFAAVGAFYGNFRQVNDDTVQLLLRKANENLPKPAQPV
jgi:putative phosphoribosyl transferase